MVRHLNKLAVVFNDLHIPFHDENLLHIALKCCIDVKPNLIILNGDFFDFYGISRFDSSPNRADDLEYELTIGREVLQLIRYAFPRARIVFIMGNHEERLTSFLSRGKNKALFNLSCLKIPNLLNFEKYKIEFCEDKFYLNKKFIITHGSKEGLEPAKAQGLSLMKNGISGHAHKTQKFERNFLDLNIEWNSTGCMCKIEELKYATKFSHTWNKGFCFVKYDDKNFQVSNIKYLGNSFHCPINGNLYFNVKKS